MNLPEKESIFLKKILDLEIFTRTQIASILKECEASGKKLFPFLLQKQYLNQKQISSILQTIQCSDLESSCTEDLYTPPTQTKGILPPAKELSTPATETIDVKENQEVPTRHSCKLSESSQISPGQIFGDCEILEEIGRGGMGIVYKAHQRGMDRIVALKILRTDFLTNKTQVKRFLREAKANAKLSHPNIVPIYTMGIEKSIPYFVMKYIPGTTFQAYLERNDVSLKSKVGIVMKICYALQHAHEKKILHRDLKPSNILLSHEYVPFLSDFGLAKFLDSQSRLTKTGSLLGTPFYMAPEQLKTARGRVTSSIDIYSMGVILYQVLTRRLPFLAENISELYLKISQEEPPRPSVLCQKRQPFWNPYA